MNPIDWQAVRADYESGQFSLSELERKHGVSRKAIRNHAHKDQWSVPVDSGPRSQNSPKQRVPNRDVNAAKRVEDAIKYRQKGWTYERIAAECGYGDPSTARKAIQRELDRILVQNVEAWRNDHISRLEKLHEEIWPLAMDKNNKGRLFALDRLLVIEEREAKLLGLEKKSDGEQNTAQIIVQEVPMGFLGDQKS